MAPRCETDLRRVGDPDYGVLVRPPADAGEGVAYWAWHSTVRNGTIYANVLRTDHALPPQPRDAIAGRRINAHAVLAWAVTDHAEAA